MKRNAVAAIGRSKCMQSGKGENEEKTKETYLGKNQESILLAILWCFVYIKLLLCAC
jgi:hypothetical protein